MASPVSLRSSGSATLAGRIEERARIERAYRDVASGGPAVVLVTGEAGAGKSRLISEVARQLELEGARLLTGFALPGEGVPPLFALERPLRTLLADDDLAIPQTVRTIVSVAVSGGADQEELARLTAAAEQLRVFEGVAQLLEAAAAQRPLVLVLDDLQWAGAGLWDLLAYVVRVLPASALLILVAARDEVLRTDAPMARSIGEISRLRRLSHVPVPGLSAEDIEQLAEALLGRRPSPALRDHLFARTAGNAFFCEEVLADYVRRGLMEDDGSVISLLPGRDMDATIPYTLKLALSERIAELGAGDESLLSYAAVAGRTFPSELLAAATGRSPADVGDALRRAESAGLFVRSGSEWSFRHDLLREALMEEAGERLPRLHAAIAHALESGSRQESDYSLLARVAGHYGAAGESALAAQAAIGAAKAALRGRMFDEAAHQARTAAAESRRVSAEDEWRLAWEANLLLGNAELEAGNYPAAETAFRSAIEAAERGDDRARAMAWAGLASAFRHREMPADAIACLDRAIPALEGADLAEALVDYATVAGLTLGDYAGAESAANRAIAIGRELDAPGLIAKGELALANARTRSEGPVSARPLLRSALAQAEAAGDAALGTEIAASLSNSYYWTGELRDAERFGRRRLELAERGHDVFGLRHAHSWLALLAATRGEWTEARTLLAEAEPALSRLSNPEPVAFIRVVESFICLRLGDAEEAYAACRTALDALEPLGPATTLWYAGLLIQACIASGRLPEAERELAAQEARIRELPESALPGRSARAVLALVYAGLGMPERGAECERALSGYASDFHWSPVERSLAALAALRGDFEEALRRLEAVEQWARAEGARPDLALALASRAQLLPAEHAERPAIITEARSLLVELGMKADLARLNALPPERVRAPFALTPREVEVLRLVAAGYTNREVADVLVISERTVINHLSHIFPKIEVDNRAGATAFAHRHKLV